MPQDDGTFTVDEVEEMIRHMTATHKPFLRRPRDLGADDLEGVFRSVRAGTCPTPELISLCQETFDELEVSVATRVLLDMAPLPTVRCVIDPEIPPGRVRVRWPGWPDEEGDDG